MTHRVFIDGAAGTTGLEIAERLAGRPEYHLLALDEDRRKDPAARTEALNAADFVILSLPDDAAREAAAMIREPRVRVIDASSAHRTAPGWTYGFPEFATGQRARIAGADRLSNPGCYPTGFVAMVTPLVAAGLLPATHGYTVHAVSGFSGGGKALIARFDAEPDLAWRGYAYKGTHKHVAEMQARAGLTLPPLFSPAVVPAYRGMVVEVPLVLAAIPGAGDADAIADALAAHYAGEPLVRVRRGTDEELLLHRAEAPHDGLLIDVVPALDGRAVRLVARLDNLGKGASGAAVQNLNLMAGVDELAGLVVPG